MADTTLHTIPAEVSAQLASDVRNTRLLKIRWLYHFLYWFLYYSLTIALYSGLHEPIRKGTFATTAIMVAIQAGFFCINTYLLIPRLLFTRKYGWYALSLALLLIICPFVIQSFQFLYGFWADPVRMKTIRWFSMGNWIVEVIICIYAIGLATGVKFAKDTLINQHLQEQREKHYLETELKFLRAQIQPHFFFNTLNNIYSLTLKKSDQAPEIVLKLSDLMSYMLYESTAPLVPLTKEIDYLRNYLDVEQLRFGSRLTISFTMEGDISSVQIPPMILILFLENSFKHGVKNNISDILLTIHLKVEAGYLFFHVENPAPEEDKVADTKGIGLKNVRRRLDLLYGDRHTLDIREENHLFIVTLKMPLC
ncbi:MAG TPA: histidine kinase [Puia sp.]|uniref:sensor histidine kinase n=1 Tax=Puia sp. TaxID=2045100 RepID=UPI002BC72A34|nr:histidine kinase [Puia sp.]HVU94750.1 histidine kinase [Puia sp.]